MEGVADLQILYKSQPSTGIPWEQVFTSTPKMPGSQIYQPQPSELKLKHPNLVSTGVYMLQTLDAPQLQQTPQQNRHVAWTTFGRFGVICLCKFGVICLNMGLSCRRKLLDIFRPCFPRCAQETARMKSSSTMGRASEAVSSKAEGGTFKRSIPT